MKIYRRPSAKIFAGLALFCIFLFIVGVILAIMSFEQLNIIVFLIGLGGSIGILFSAVAIAEYVACIKIDDTRIIFHPAVRKIKNKGKCRICCKKLEIPFSEIKKMSPHIQHGDGIISKDTMVYDFKLKNGDSFSITLYSYGKQRERKIVTILNEHIK